MAGSENRWLRTKDLSGDAYDARYDERAAAGENVHGEADFVMRYAPRSVLDAGCGTGRVARELARRGVEVVGVDLDPDMLATARRRSPKLQWVQADLASFDLGRTFDVVVAAGNVMILLTPGTEPAVLLNVARHLQPSGLLVAGFQLRAGHLTLAEYDRAAAAAGFRLEERVSTWDRDPPDTTSPYAVSVHRSLELAVAQRSEDVWAPDRSVTSHGGTAQSRFSAVSSPLRSKMVVATIPVTDLDRSKQFYGGTLGLPLLHENPFSARYDAGAGSQLSIFKRPPTKTEHTLAHFEVDDIETTVRDLKAKGVRFHDYADGPLKTTDSIAQLGPNRSAWFTDPDGSTLGITQPA